MQFSSKEDIEAPMDAVFAMLSDFESFERSAIRRGVDLDRLPGAGSLHEGKAWKARFTMRGKLRDMRIELASYMPPQAMVFTGDSQGIDARLTLDLIALSPRRTRLAIVLNLAPKTLAARLFLQSVKLAKTTLTKRFKLRIADYARSLGERYERQA